MEIDRKNNTDTFDVYVEMSELQMSDRISDIQKREKEIEASMRAMLGIGYKIHLVPLKSIARSEGKAVRVVDKRKLHD